MCAVIGLGNLTRKEITTTFSFQVIRKLPESRYHNIRYLIKFFHELSRHQEHNKMTAQNLAIVLAPSLIWSPV